MKQTQSRKPCFLINSTKNNNLKQKKNQNPITTNLNLNEIKCLSLESPTKRNVEYIIYIFY